LRYTIVEGLSRARETATTGSAAVDRQRRSTNCGFLRLVKPVPHRTPLERKPGAAAHPMDFLKPRLTPMNRRRRIYEGKAKVLYEGPEPGTLIQHFKDDATAFNAKKHEIIDGKGVLNNRISEYVFQNLNAIGVPTHFIRRLNMREQLIREVEIIPLEVVVRNVAAGSLAKRLGMEEGTQLPRSIIEFYYKNDALDDPMVSEEHITAFGWASPQEIDDIMALAIRVNDFLSGLFLGVGIRLVDFKMECGRLWEGEMMRIVVADEISPDSCRLWDIKSNDKLDKDRFRRDMGGLVEAYTEVARRLGIMQENEPTNSAAPKLVE
jgi:phosphoribosylaminoimidazole-succinocarboxamide synthase